MNLILNKKISFSTPEIFIIKQNSDIYTLFYEISNTSILNETVDALGKNVYAILGVIMTIGTLSVIGVMNKAKSDVGEFTKKQITDAAVTYVLDNQNCGTNCSISNKTDILEKLSPYYPEINDKCTIENNAQIEISNTDEDIKVTSITGITCKE